MSTCVFIQSIKSLGTCTLLCLAYRTYKQDCTAAIKVKLSGDKKALEVVEMDMDHNHEINRNAFLNVPQQRKMDDSVSMYVVSYICYIYSGTKSDVYTT